MNDRTAEHDALIAAIERAFASVSRGETTLYEAERMDDYATTEELQACRAWDPEEDWRDIPLATIEACPDALSFVDPVSCASTSLRSCDAASCDGVTRTG